MRNYFNLTNQMTTFLSFCCLLLLKIIKRYGMLLHHHDILQRLQHKRGSLTRIGMRYFIGRNFNYLRSFEDVCQTLTTIGEGGWFQSD